MEPIYSLAANRSLVSQEIPSPPPFMEPKGSLLRSQGYTWRLSAVSVNVVRVKSRGYEITWQGVDSRKFEQRLLRRTPHKLFYNNVFQTMFRGTVVLRENIRTPQKKS